MVSKQILFGLINLVILIAGCVHQAEETEQNVNNTALLSFTEFFCFGTEYTNPTASFQFAYQENCQIQYVKTKTICEYLIKIGFSNDASKNPTIFGEQIKLQYKWEKPVKITRENGDIYDIEESEQIRSFFTSGINAYANLKYLKNSNSDKVLDECSLISEKEHDRCLSFQAGFLQDENICNSMKMTYNQDLCKLWIQNIKEEKINK